MTKKRKRYPTLDDKVDRPWCYYCERDFDDLKILISHQKAKHFKCDKCGRRLNTAGGLNVHMTQVHKEQLTQVENAIAGRGGLDIEIFGMEGVPVEILDQHNMAVTEKHFADERARQAATGNPTRGSGGNGFTSKRPRTKETLEEILQNLEKWKADKKNGVLPPPIGEINNDQTPPPVNPFAAPAGVFPGQFPVGGFPLSAFPPAPPGGVPGVSGLPQRPPFGAPPPALFPPNGAQPGADFDASLNQLISDAQKPPTADAPVEKKSKKNINLVFFDDGDSPEEKMAALSKFAALART